MLLLTRSVENPSTSTTPNAHNCRILKTTFVKEVMVISAPAAKEVDPLLTSTSTLPPINTTQVRMREQQAVRRAQIDASRIGVGVSQQAQEIFNSLCKTLPCKWFGETIVVFDDVRIPRPYGLQDVVGSDLAAVNRVKKVLDGERRKLGLSN